LDRTDQHYHRCRELIETTTDLMIIPEPVLVEVDYWVSQRLHAGVFVPLLDDILAGAFSVLFADRIGLPPNSGAL